MAKQRGRVIHRDGGMTAGLVGDYPIEEAFEIIREGRFSPDYPDTPALGGLGIPELLAGLQVESISALAALVARARANHVYVVLVPPDVSDDPVRWCFTDESDALTFARAHGAGAHVSFEPVSTGLADPSFLEYAFGCGVSPKDLEVD